eukprot:g8855.t1
MDTMNTKNSNADAPDKEDLTNAKNNADVPGKEQKNTTGYEALLSEYRFSKMDAAYNTVVSLSYVICLIVSFMYKTSPTGCSSYKSEEVITNDDNTTTLVTSHNGESEQLSEWAMIFGIAGIVKVVTWIIAYKSIKPVAEKDGGEKQLKPEEAVDYLYYCLDTFVFVWFCVGNGRFARFYNSKFAGETASNCTFLRDFALTFFIVNWVLYFAFGFCVSNGKFINDKINGYRVAPK